MARCFDRRGRSITTRRYRELEALDAYRRVGWTVVYGEVVATAWVGIDQRDDPPDDGSPPLIFSTLLKGRRIHYPTLAQAIRGHAAAVSVYEDTRDPVRALRAAIRASARR